MQTALNFKDSIFPGSKCARDLQLPNWHIIEECANTTQGSKLLQKYGEMTSILTKPIDVPVITFNHVSLVARSGKIDILIENSFFSIYFSISMQIKMLLQEPISDWLFVVF